MSSENPNPIADVAEGVTKGVLSFSKEQLSGLIEKFLNKELAFVEDPETINIAKEQRKTSEWYLFKQYIDEHDLRILFQLGLTLRKLERQKERVNSLRRNIIKKYETKGLHIAQLIQNGFFNRYLASALERTRTPEQLKLEIKNLLDDIENTVFFAQESDNADLVAQAIIIKILANSPKTFIICSSGYAKNRCHEIEDIMKDWVRTGTLKYEYEVYVSKYKEVFFLNKLEV